jgi:hypothetical protein
MIRHSEGVLVIDDCTLDKPYSHSIELVTRHWSGKHRRVVQGINLISTIWTDGSDIVPVDFRIYCPEKDGKNKNDHFREMVRVAEERQFQPNCVIFDSWYSSIENLKLLRALKWHWCTHLKSNRLVDPDHTYNRSISEIEISLKKGLFTCANMVSSRFSEPFMLMEMLSIGLEISSMHQNLTENRSKILGGTSKNFTGA